MDFRKHLDNIFILQMLTLMRWRLMDFPNIAQAIKARASLETPS